MKSAALALTVLLLGCKGGYDQSQMARLTAPEQAIVGRYEMETDFSAIDSKELRGLIEAIGSMEGGDATLECFPNHSYVMEVSGIPVSGSWSLEKGLVRLRIQKVGDKNPEDIQRVKMTQLDFGRLLRNREQGEEFMSEYVHSIALDRAESMAAMRVGADGTLYGQGSSSSILFGTVESYFKKQPK